MERSRVVEADVDVKAGSVTTRRQVAISYQWAGPDPEHMCLPASCGDCHLRLERAAMGSARNLIAVGLRITGDGQKRRIRDRARR